MSKRQAALVGSLVVLLCSGTVSAVAVEPSTAAIKPAAIGGTSQGVTEISQCTTIDEPGRYVLTSDITDSGARHCIRIIASDVVFDGQGHTLDARTRSNRQQRHRVSRVSAPLLRSYR